jgi:hypothetical protein
MRHATAFSVISHTKYYTNFHVHKTYTEARIDQHFSDTFSIQNSLKEGRDYRIFFIYFALEYAIRKIEVLHFAMKLNRHTSFWSALV